MSENEKEIKEQPVVEEEVVEEKEDKKETAKSDVDPLIIEYADSLKEKLGDNYTEDLDKYDVKQRIEIMKHMVKVVPDNKKKSVFPKPNHNNNDKKMKKKLPIKGIDWRIYK